MSRHITRISEPDAAGQWAWECVLGDAEASGYDDPTAILDAALAHGPLAADSHRPSWADIEDDDDLPQQAGPRTEEES
jgi:hypothetical protein